jgi:DNA-binding FadR family transcriptional regulator
MENLSTSYIPENMLLLRRRLMLSQTELIDNYLTSEEKRPLLSVSKLSKLEKKENNDSERFAAVLAQKFTVDPKLFQLPPDDFAKNIDLFLGGQRPSQGKALNEIAPLVKKTSQVETLVNIISDYLVDRILAGELKPGDKLPSDRDLSALFNVGRTSIREALKVLSVLGMINILPGQGSFIASDSTEFFLTPLSWTFLLGEKNLEHVISVRNVLEIESARLAALKASPEDLSSLQEIFEHSKNAYTESNYQLFLDLDLDFHLAIAECSHNPILHNLLLTSRKLIKHISKSGMLNLADLGAVYQEHTRIYENIAQQNSAEAVASMTVHLENAQKRYHLNFS